MKINRRTFLSQTAVGATAAYAGLNFGLMPIQKAHADSDDDHFFLAAFIEGGFDWSYAVDARPLAMKAAGLHNTYLQSEPTPYTGSNGQTTLIAPTAGALRPWLSRMTIVNGAMVSQSFDGHDQNLNVILSTSPFGGESFIPMLNSSSARWRPRPIDMLVLEPLFLATVTNGGRSVPLGRNDAVQLIASLQRNPLHAPQSRLAQFVQSRYARAGMGRGAFALGARKIDGSFATAHSLSQMMTSIQIPTLSNNDMVDTCQYMSSLFKGGVTRSAQMVIRSNFADGTRAGVADIDAHAPSQARRYPELAESQMNKLAELFAALSSTPYDSTRSLLDVTTVMITSEFARSLKSPFGTFDQAGTEHNGLTNSILLAGKGIKTGMVVGASDFQSATEVLSEAHAGPNGADVQKYRSMARPMDLAALTVRTDLPLGFVQEDYLNVTHVTNTLLKLFGVPENLHRPLRANTPIAPIVRGLLA